MPAYPPLTAAVGTYMGGEDAETIFADIHLVNQVGPVPFREVKNLMLEQGTWSNYKDAEADPLHAGHSVAVNTVTLLTDPDGGDLDLEDARVQGGMTAGVTTGLMTGDQRTAIEALKDNRRSKAQAGGYAWATLPDVVRALAWQ